MRAKQLHEGKKNPGKRELLALATEFIDSSFQLDPAPSWQRDDGSYDWAAARDAHLSQLPASRLIALSRDATRALSKIHYKIWLENEIERLGVLIQELGARRVLLSQKLSALDVFS